MKLYISPYGAYQDSLGVHDIIIINIIIMLSVYLTPLGNSVLAHQVFGVYCTPLVIGPKGELAH